jgi:hypothetical protein
MMQADYQDSCKQLEDADKLLDFVEVLQILLTTLHDLHLCVWYVHPPLPKLHSFSKLHI